MGSANVDLVRSIYAAWERGDFSSADWAHPDIEYVHADGLAAGSWTGLAGMTQAFLDFINAWEDWSVEAQELRALDGERVLVLFRFSGRGKASGLEVGQVRTEGANLFHFRAGKVTRLVQYLDRERSPTSASLPGLAPGTRSRLLGEPASHPLPSKEAPPARDRRRPNWTTSASLGRRAGHFALCERSGPWRRGRVHCTSAR